MACGPLAHSVEWLAGKEKISEQDEESGGGIDAAASIGAGEIVAKEVFESQASEDAIEDGEESDAVGEELVSSGLSVSAELGGGLGIVGAVHGRCSRWNARKGGACSRRWPRELRWRGGRESRGDGVGEKKIVKL